MYVHVEYTMMKASTVAVLIMMAMPMMFTIAYSDNASSHGTKTEETTAVAISHASNGGSSFTSGKAAGRKLLQDPASTDSAGVSTDSNHYMTVKEYKNYMSFVHHP